MPHLGYLPARVATAEGPTSAPLAPRAPLASPRAPAGRPTLLPASQFQNLEAVPDAVRESLRSPVARTREAAPAVAGGQVQAAAAAASAEEVVPPASTRGSSSVGEERQGSFRSLLLVEGTEGPGPVAEALLSPRFGRGRSPRFSRSHSHSSTEALERSRSVPKSLGSPLLLMKRSHTDDLRGPPAPPCGSKQSSRGRNRLCVRSDHTKRRPRRREREEYGGLEQHFKGEQVVFLKSMSPPVKDAGVQTHIGDTEGEPQVSPRSFLTHSDLWQLLGSASCSICLEHLRGRAVTVTLCGHVFHRSCLNQAGLTDGRNLRCPQCRQPVDAEPTIEEPVPTVQEWEGGVPPWWLVEELLELRLLVFGPEVPTSLHTARVPVGIETAADPLMHTLQPLPEHRRFYSIHHVGPFMNGTAAPPGPPPQVQRLQTNPSVQPWQQDVFQWHRPPVEARLPRTFEMHNLHAPFRYQEGRPAVPPPEVQGPWLVPASTVQPLPPEMWDAGRWWHFEGGP